MIPLREYQQDHIIRIRAARRRSCRIIVVQATTGSGKTVTASHIARESVRLGKRVLFTVHRRKLVDQISDTLRECEVPHGVIMRGEHCQHSAPVQVASRDTLASRHLDNQWYDMPPADLVIVDEAHLAAGAGSEHRRILEQYPNATILLFSATPVGPDGKGLGPWAQAIECAIGTEELIRGKYLVPVKCFAPERRKYANGKIRKRGIAGDLVESWKTYAEGKPTVLFTSRVAHSLDAVEAFREEGIPFAHIDANTSDDDRDNAFRDLKRGLIRGISNVGIVGLGVDIPELTVCQLYLDLDSRVRFLQACGRIMRPHPSKKYGILIDHSAAVYRCGFPDENTEWTLEGNVDEQFRKKKADGKTKDAHYCSKCEMLYKDTLRCPGCGLPPARPPKSIFAPPPIEHTDDPLSEAERGHERVVGNDREERVKTWMACLGLAIKRNGTFAMAGSVYKNKYKEYPPADFPCNVPFHECKMKVKDVYPNFGRRQ